MSERADEILEQMKALLANSRKLAQEHDQLMEDYEKLKKELDKLRDARPARPGQFSVLMNA